MPSKRSTAATRSLEQSRSQIAEAAQLDSSEGETAESEQDGEETQNVVASKSGMNEAVSLRSHPHRFVGLAHAYLILRRSNSKQLSWSGWHCSLNIVVYRSREETSSSSVSWCLILLGR